MDAAAPIVKKIEDVIRGEGANHNPGKPKLTREQADAVLPALCSTGVPVNEGGLVLGPMDVCLVLSGMANDQTGQLESNSKKENTVCECPKQGGCRFRLCATTDTRRHCI